MSKMIAINFSPDEKTLRQFGWIALAGFGFIAAIAWFEVLIFSAIELGAAKPWVVGISGGLALLAAIFSLVWPKANLPIFVGLSVITFPIGFVLSYLIMGFLFYVLIAPVAIFFKLIGRDPMHRSYDPDATSYWSEPRAKRPNADYFKQY
jgi:hypothetical protein